MANNYRWISFFVTISFLLLGRLSYAAEKSGAEESVEKRQMLEIMTYFQKDPKDAQVPKTVIAVQLFNQAVEYYERQEYDLARQQLRASLEQDDSNPFAYELLGDIEYYQQNLSEAKMNYEIAYSLEPRAELKTKLEKVRQEAPIERQLSTAQESNFIIKYQNKDQSIEQYQMRELLRDTYRQISQDFAYYFKHRVVVLLYDEKDFKQITNMPHWVGGLYDGKVRMPINKQGFTDLDLKALTTHEVTHAFVHAMSLGRAPAWINEGLAEYEENKVKSTPLNILNISKKNNTLFPIDLLLSQGGLNSIQDTTRVSLFYEQSHHLVKYLIDRYRMYKVKEMLAEYGKGKNSDEVVRTVLGISSARLEREWLATV